MSEHELWNELGNLYFMAGAYGQAVHAYERSIQADTTFGRPYSNLALTYVQQGKYEQAVELYRRSIELLAENKEKAISWNRLGAVYRHLKDYSRAVIAFQEADQLDPASAQEFPATTEMRRQANESPSSVLSDPVGEPAPNEVAEQPAPPESAPTADEPIEVLSVDESPLTAEPAAEQPEAALCVDESPIAADLTAEPVEAELPVDEGPMAAELVVEVLEAGAPVDEIPTAAALTTEPLEAETPVGESPMAAELAIVLIEVDAPVDESPMVTELTAEPLEAEPSVDESPIAAEPAAAEFVAELAVEDAPLAMEPASQEFEPDIIVQESPIAAEMAPCIDEPEPLVYAWLSESESEREPFTQFEPGTAEAETVAVEEQTSDPELEWWDVDEERVLLAATGRPVASIAADDPNASWTPADTSQFQQDLSQMPETGSLTTWGDGDIDDDFELFPSLGTEPGQDLPDPDGERIATWIPLPEEGPLNLDESWIQPFVEEQELEAEIPLEWNEAPAYHLLDSIDFGTVPPPSPRPTEPVEYMPRPEMLPVRQATSTQQSWDQLDVDVAVEERPSDIALGTQQSPILPDPVTVREVLEQPGPQPQPVAESSLNAQPPALPDSERDEEEMHEIEMGIARFRRVVQVNPRNAHAWDALGTLYKSAGLYRDATLAYQQAISNDPSKSLYYHHLGLVYACEGRDEDAIAAFQRVLEIDPQYSLAHATLGGYYRKMGLEELAQKHIGKAMKSIFDSENEYNRACLEAICGNADQAIELLGVALKNKQTYVDWILRDPDLDFIRQDPRFKQLISDYTR